LSDGRPLPFDSIVATGKGDDGTTGLLYGGDRVAKDDPRTEAYGTVDEAVAALGMARAELGLKAGHGVLTPGFGTIGDLVLRLQRELFVVAAEMATDHHAWDRLEDGRTRVSEAMVDDIGRILADLESRIEMPREFVVPGETRASAALEMGRTILRRAERRAVALRRAGALPPDSLAVPYLNRVADLLWVLARAAEQAEARQATPATKAHQATPATKARQATPAKRPRSPTESRG
jgi:cob(I)alamin adenosyltransferase